MFSERLTSKIVDVMHLTGKQIDPSWIHNNISKVNKTTNDFIDKTFLVQKIHKVCCTQQRAQIVFKIHLGFLYYQIIKWLEYHRDFFRTVKVSF